MLLAVLLSLFLPVASFPPWPCRACWISWGEHLLEHLHHLLLLALLGLLLLIDDEVAGVDVERPLLAA